MIEVSTTLFLLALAAVPISWLLPRQWALDGVAAWTLLVLAWLARFRRFGCWLPPWLCR